jgi:hypothetical protein
MALTLLNLMGLAIALGHSLGRCFIDMIFEVLSFELRTGTDYP